MTFDLGDTSRTHTPIRKLKGVFKKKKMNNRKIVFTYAAAMIAYLIGSGFASGQEAMQFYAGYGIMGAFFGTIVSGIIIFIASSSLFCDAHVLKLKDANTCYQYYLGKTFGKVCQWISPIFLYALYVVMLSGAGSVLNEFYGLPGWVGRVGMMVITMITVMMGLDKLTDVLSFVGPVIVVFALGVSIAAIITNPAGIVEAAHTIKSYEIVKATPFWGLSGVTYATLCTLTLAPYLIGIGANLENDKQGILSGFFGSLVFTLAMMTLSLGMLAHIDVVWDKSIPTVYLADTLIHGLGYAFSVAMLAGVFTTAVPYLWSAVNKIVPEEGSKKFKGVTAGLAIFALVGGMLPFKTLVNIIFPYAGYFGMIIFAGIVVKRFTKKKA